MKTYSEKLKDPRWQKKRLKILNRDKFTCKLCGDTETTLHVHHKEYISGNDPWDYPNKLLVTICGHCHNELSCSNLKSIPFNDISIFKNKGWTSGHVLLFTSVPNKFCIMSIYDENVSCISGYVFGSILSGEIIKILKKAL